MRFQGGTELPRIAHADCCRHLIGLAVNLASLSLPTYRVYRGDGWHRQRLRRRCLAGSAGLAMLVAFLLCGAVADAVARLRRCRCGWPCQRIWRPRWDILSPCQIGSGEEGEDDAESGHREAP
jgi:hypothetical protein